MIIFRLEVQGRINHCFTVNQWDNHSWKISPGEVENVSHRILKNFIHPEVWFTFKISLLAIGP